MARRASKQCFILVLSMLNVKKCQAQMACSRQFWPHGHLFGSDPGHHNCAVGEEVADANCAGDPCAASDRAKCCIKPDLSKRCGSSFDLHNAPSNRLKCPDGVEVRRDADCAGVCQASDTARCCGYPAKCDTVFVNHGDSATNPKKACPNTNEEVADANCSTATCGDTDVETCCVVRAKCDSAFVNHLTTRSEFMACPKEKGGVVANAKCSLETCDNSDLATCCVEIRATIEIFEGGICDGQAAGQGRSAPLLTTVDMSKGKCNADMLDFGMKHQMGLDSCGTQHCLQDQKNNEINCWNSAKQSTKETTVIKIDVFDPSDASCKTTQGPKYIETNVCHKINDTMSYKVVCWTDDDVAASVTQPLSMAAAIFAVYFYVIVA